MLYIEDDYTIRLTRGDTAYLQVDITNADRDKQNAEYEFSSGDSLTLSIKKNIKDSEYLLNKVITGSKVFHIIPEDTKDASFGKYVYDVQLTTEHGDIYTIIEPHAFVIMPEVTT